jgi:hypothetical protein
MGKRKFKKIEIDEQEIIQLIERLETRSLKDGDYEIIKELIGTVVNVNRELEKKKISINRLKKLFNIQNEKSKNILPEETSQNEEEDGHNDSERKGDKKKRKGHGRNGASKYSGAKKVKISHPALKKGDRCPGCLKGKLYNNIDPGVFVRVKSSPPFEAVIYEREKLRCNLCGEIYTAPLPLDAGNKKYDASVAAMIAVLKYGSGFPFYRMGVLQDMCNIPLPPSTQWEILKEAVKKIYPLYEELLTYAAQGGVIYNDDTNMKVLSLLKENKENPERKGIFTTGIVSRVEENLIALYFTGRNHAGENLNQLLQERIKSKGPPVQMCDALSRNVPKEFEVLLANCLCHGRRKFVDIIPNFPEECTFVIEQLKKVYSNDAIAKKERMTNEKRLSFHQEQSGPIMAGLKDWMDTQINEKKVEPNSGLGEAIDYMINHWEALTLFLRVPGAPLDNNIVERALKKAILHRKNSYFYKTLNGALVGDIFMSLIETCRLAKVNALKYIISLLECSDDVQTDLTSWMPWNFQETNALT